MNGPLLTVSRRQKNVTLSSTEAEYCAFTDIIKDVKWLKKVAKALNIKFPKPAVINNDNQTAENLAQGVAKLNRTKHIDTRYHFIKECIALGIIKLLHIPREKNLADLFTHPVGVAIHKKMRNEILNLKEINSQSNETIDEKELALMANINISDENIDRKVLALMANIIITDGHSKNETIDLADMEC